MKLKKGLSPVIASVLLVLLAVVIVGIVWGVYTSLVKEELNSAKNCLDTFNKIEINKEYTCPDEATNQFQFSIEVGDVELEEILVNLQSISGSKTFSLKNETQQINGLRIYENTYDVVMPGPNSAITYIVNLTKIGFSQPDEIKIIPVVGGEQCESVDSAREFFGCQIPSEPSGNSPSW